MYDTLLVATDGSADSESAIAHAIELAVSMDATLHAVSVVETRTAYDNAIIDPTEVRENLRSDAHEALERAKTAAADAGLSCDTTLSEGPPPDRILTVAEEVGADVIVVGATGRSGFKRLVLGGTAERLLESASIPVIVIGGASTPTLD